MKLYIIKMLQLFPCETNRKQIQFSVTLNRYVFFSSEIDVGIWTFKNDGAKKKMCGNHGLIYVKKYLYTNRIFKNQFSLPSLNRKYLSAISMQNHFG